MRAEQVRSGQLVGWSRACESVSGKGKGGKVGNAGRVSGRRGGASLLRDWIVSCSGTMKNGALWRLRRGAVGYCRLL